MKYMKIIYEKKLYDKTIIKDSFKERNINVIIS